MGGDTVKNFDILIHWSVRHELVRGLHSYVSKPLKEVCMNSNRKPIPADIGSDLDKELNEVTVTKVGQEHEEGMVPLNEMKFGSLADVFPKKNSVMGSGEAGKAQEKKKQEAQLKAQRDPKNLQKLYTPKWKQNLPALLATLVVVGITSILLVMLTSNRRVVADKEAAKREAAAARAAAMPSRELQSPVKTPEPQKAPQVQAKAPAAEAAKAPVTQAAKPTAKPAVKATAKAVAKPAQKAAIRKPAAKKATAKPALKKKAR